MFSSSSHTTLRRRMLTRSHPGRERSPSQPALQEGNLSRADHIPRRVRHQDLGPAVDYVTKPEVFPDARESQFQHRPKYREENCQLQFDPVRSHHLHGSTSGLRCPVLLPRSKEGLRVNHDSPEQTGLRCWARIWLCRVLCMAFMIAAKGRCL